MQYFQPQLKNEDLPPCGRCDLCAQSRLELTPDQQQLLSKLRHWRQLLNQKYGPQLPTTFLIPEASLIFLTLLQPVTRGQLAGIPGLGRGVLSHDFIYQSLLKMLK